VAAAATKADETRLTNRWGWLENDVKTHFQVVVAKGNRRNSGFDDGDPYKLTIYCADPAKGDPAALIVSQFRKYLAHMLGMPEGGLLRRIFYDPEIRAANLKAVAVQVMKDGDVLDNK